MMETQSVIQREPSKGFAPPTKAKIAHIVLGLEVGGLERVVLRLLERTDRDRYSPVVCVLDKPGAMASELARLDVPLEVFPRRPGVDIRLALALARWIRKERIDIVHTHNPSPHLYGALGATLSSIVGLAGGGASSWSRPRVVHTKHGRNHPNDGRKVLVNRIASALSDTIVAVSDDARAVALDIERVAPDRVVTILNGVDFGEYHPGGDPLEARNRLGIPAAGFHVGCVARLSPEKDHANLLGAFALLVTQLPDAHLTLVGDGPCRADLERLANERGLARSVTFAGVRDDIAKLLPAFDVFALSSSTEGISLTLIEAASTGLPIVATRVGGNGEIVSDGESGLLVPSKNPEALGAALVSMAGRTPGERRVMGAIGRTRVIDRFGIDRMVGSYLALYDRLLKGTS